MLERSLVLKLKLSRFNLITNHNDDLVIMNTLYKSIFKSCNPEVNRFIRNYDSCNTVVLSKFAEELVLALTSKRILVPYNQDELKIADMRYYQMVYSNNLMVSTIIPTTKCNFKCVYCYEDDNQSTMTQEIAQGIVRYYAQTLPKFKHSIINWYGGEPLLALDTVLYIMNKVKKICQQNRTVLLGSITTNGSLLTVNKMNLLLDAGVNMFQISIDGDENLHNKQRPLKNGADSYQIILNNLMGIRDQIKNRRFEITLRINISKEIDRQRIKILDDLGAQFANNPRFTMGFEWIRNWGGEINEDIVTTAEITRNWINEASKRKIRCNDILANNCGIEYCDSCRKHGYFIDVDGSLKKCSIAIYDKKYKDVNHVGQISNSGRVTLDEDKEAKWVCRDNPGNKCLSCVIYPMCMSVNCPLATQIQKNKICMPIKNIIPDLIGNRAEFVKYDFT